MNKLKHCDIIKYEKETYVMACEPFLCLL